MPPCSCWKALRLILCIVIGPSILYAQSSTPPHWTYDGKEGPKHWSELDPSFSPCSLGKHQSPINIKHAKMVDLPALQFNYNPAPLNIVDNGHTILVNYAPGSTVTIGDKTYALKQFHFHHPSEEEIKGKHYDLVAHLVHADASGHNAVVAILFKVDAKAAASPLLDTLWKNVSQEKGKVIEVSSISINVKDLLPAETGYYTFSGSLTTPPCTEGVDWYILKTPVTIPESQLAFFAKIYKHDNRPLQPINHREVFESK